MKTRLFAIVASLSFIFVSFTWAQGPGRGARNYNPATETTVKGVVDQVQEVSGRRGWNGTHLMLKTEAGTVDVHVGPSSYVAAQGFSFSQGDQVQVLGSKVKLAGGEALIAREIKRGEKTLVLRDANGMPQWAGGRRSAN